jgi:S1-C subfamily serine protease
VSNAVLCYDKKEARKRCVMFLPAHGPRQLAERTLLAVSLCTVFAGFVSSTAAQEGQVSNPVAKAVDATVFVRVDHLYSGRGVTSSGTGFLIHGNGWILTNEHVVSDTMIVPVGNEWRRANAKVTKVAVVLRSGSAEELEVNAKIVARDPDADLALLKVPGPQDPVLDIWTERTPSVTDEVWVVGYPYGELLAIERWENDEMANPEASVNQGRVSALRKDNDGNLRLIQTDAAVNPGNSGGAMIDGEGHFLGVVSAKVGSDGIGFAIASDQVREFVLKKGYRVEYRPPTILDSTKEIAVRLESDLIELAKVKGALTVGGGETPNVSSPLRPDGRGLTARVALTGRPASDAARGVLRARIELQRDDGQSVGRVFRLYDAVGKTTVQADGSLDDDADAGTGDTEVVDSSRSQGLGLSGGKFGAARSSGDGSGSAAVISDELMAKINEFRFDDRHYEGLPKEYMREMAERYDRKGYDLYRALTRYIRRDRSKRSAEADARAEMQKLIGDLRALQGELRKDDICRCGPRWLLCAEADCSDPEKPWIEDDLGVVSSLISSF